jgi:cell division protein FtsL
MMQRGQKPGQRAEDSQDTLKPVALGIENGGRVKQVRFNSSTLYAPFDVVAKRYGADTDPNATRNREPGRTSRRTSAVSSDNQREALSLSVLMTTLLIMAGTFHVMAMIVVETNRWLESRAQIARLEHEISTIRTDMNALETQLVYRNDDGMLEQLARRQGFIYPNETRVITLFNVFE